MFRIYKEKIQKWLKESRKALLIDGARQVGKTYLVRETLKESGISYFEINFIERRDLKEALKSIDDTNSFIERLSLYSPVPLEKGSVIFFDEVQEIPEIITKIKFLVDEGSYRYVLSGSLLGVELKNVRSVPIGYMEAFRMYPMNFYEFSLALGVKEETWKYLEKCFDGSLSVDEVTHGKMLALFNYYLIVGGMPSVVKTFIETKNMYRVDAEQQNIINQYKADFTKYERNDKKLKIISVYENIPPQLRKQNMKFVFSYLDKELKFDRYENSFLWLESSGVALPTYIASEPKSPLILSKEKNAFKLFMSDVGLLTAFFPFSVREEILSAKADGEINKSAIFENFVAEELKTAGEDLYYYKSVKLGEIDFLVEIDGKTLPIEVKSGNNYKTHRALINLISSEEYGIGKARVLSAHNFETDGKIIYTPIYMAGFIKQTPIKANSVEIDITGV